MPKEKVAKRKGTATRGAKKPPITVTNRDYTGIETIAAHAGKETSLFLLPAAAIHGGLKIRDNRF